MNRTTRFLGSTGVLALSILAAAPAMAAGTASGTVITNTVTVDYQVGGIAQTAATASNSVTVDRKVNLTVAEVGAATTQVAPGQTNAVTAFTVTNLSNATLDFVLSAAQASGGAGAHSNTDSFDATNVRIFADTNSNGSFDVGTDQQITYLDELAADQSRTIFVVSNIPSGQTSGSVAAVILTATAREGGTASSQGAALTETNTGTTNETTPTFVDTVFADGAGKTDSTRDGAFSAMDDYTVVAASLTVLKSSKVIDDPLNGTTNPKAIPGATIEYCISVANAAGGATATVVSISDPLPTDVTYDSSFGIFVNGTVTGSVCNADGTSGGTYDAPSTTVSGALSDIAAGESRTLRFRAKID